MGSIPTTPIFRCDIAEKLVRDVSSEVSTGLLSHEVWVRLLHVPFGSSIRKEEVVKGKEVSLKEVIGATVVDIEMWGAVTVEKDGKMYEINAVEGYSGIENEVREA